MVVQRWMMGTVLAALELNHNDGPWTLKDDYQKVNGVVRAQAAVRVDVEVTGTPTARRPVQILSWKLCGRSGC